MRISFECATREFLPTNLPTENGSYSPFQRLLLQPDVQPEMCSFCGYFQVLGSPQQPCKLLEVLDVPTLSRQRSRVRVSSSPPFFSSTCGKLGLLRGNKKEPQKITSLFPPLQFEAAPARSLRLRVQYNRADQLEHWSLFLLSSGGRSGAIVNLAEERSEASARPGPVERQHKMIAAKP